VRILHVTEASGAGTLHVVRWLGERHALADHEVAIALGRRPQTPPEPREGLPEAVTVLELPWERRSAKAQLTAGRALRALAAAWRPDLVHLHSSFAGVVGSAALGRRLPVVYTPHGWASARTDLPRARLAALRAVEHGLARRCAVIGAVSEAEAAHAREVLNAPRVAVVGNGIPELEPGRRPAVPERRGRPRVVVLGRVCPQRRPAAAARILAAVRGQADVEWIGSATSAEGESLSRAGVSTTGWLSHEQALERLAGATVLLHWSAWDGAPLAVLEAVARDVVVVASDIPANAELLGAAGVEPDEGAAIDAIRRLLADPQGLVDRLAEQRVRTAGRTAARMAEAWLALYFRVLADRAVGR